MTPGATNSKHPLQSKGIWGGSIALLALVVLICSPHLFESPESVEGVCKFLGAVGALLAIYGRKTATKTLKPFFGETPGSAPGSSNTPSLALVGIVVVGGACMMTGCHAGGESVIDSKGIRASGNGASIVELGQNPKAAYQGVAPSALWQDQDGTVLSTPGPGGSVSVNPTTGDMYVWSPKDGRMEGVKITPQPQAGQPYFEADLIEFNLSPVVAEYTKQFEFAIDGLKEMSRNEAERQVEIWREAGDITTDFAEMLLRLYTPTLPSLDVPDELPSAPDTPSTE